MVDQSKAGSGILQVRRRDGVVDTSTAEGWGGRNKYGGGVGW